jgi:2-dehydropantoate 2-reductase
MINKKPKVFFVGAGAIGAAVAAWIAPHYEELYIMGRGETQKALKAEGITVYQTDQPVATQETIKIKTIDSLNELKDVDIIVLCVKNYSLSEIAQTLRASVGDRPLIVSMANGIENQKILPAYFSRVIYCVISFNARRDRPVMIGYQRKGPLLLGTPDGSLKDDLQTVQAIFSLGCETTIVEHFQDAVHSKIVMNLTNALDTLLGHGYQEVSNFNLYQKILTATLLEGVRIIKAAGYRECKMGGMPSFLLLWLSATLPGFITRPVFRKKIKTIVMSSMTQDILLHGLDESEIDSLTGYIVSLAKKNGVNAPFNATIYRLAKEKFGPGFQPIRCEELMAAVKEKASIKD